MQELSPSSRLLDGITQDDFPERLSSLRQTIAQNPKSADGRYQELRSALGILLGQSPGGALVGTSSPQQSLSAYFVAHAGVLAGKQEEVFKEIVLPCCWCMMEGRSVRRQWVSPGMEIELIDALLGPIGGKVSTHSDFSRGALLTQKAIQFRSQRRISEAVPLLIEAEPLLRSTDGVFAANSTRQLGLCYHDLHRHREAVEAGRRAVGYADQGAKNLNFPVVTGYDPLWQQGPGARVFLIHAIEALLQNQAGLPDSERSAFLDEISQLDIQITALGCTDLYRGLPGFQRFLRQRRGAEPNYAAMLEEALTGLALDRGAFPSAGPIDFARDWARIAFCQTMLGKFDEGREALSNAESEAAKLLAPDGDLKDVLEKISNLLSLPRK